MSVKETFRNIGNANRNKKELEDTKKKVRIQRGIIGGLIIGATGSLLYARHVKKELTIDTAKMNALDKQYKECKSKLEDINASKKIKDVKDTVTEKVDNFKEIVSEKIDKATESAKQSFEEFNEIISEKFNKSEDEK